jgi:cholest-4-en-3-one 26-monooxygenase
VLDLNLSPIDPWPEKGAMDINLLDRDVFARGVPHEWFTYLRAHEPVFRHAEPHGPGFWVVSRYADVQAISRDPGTYSSDPPAPLEETGIATEDSAARVLIAMDPPEHTRYRKLVNRGFTPRMINALEDRIRERAVRILDRAIAKGTCDFVVDVAAELPLEVIAELIGVPNEDRQKLFEWTSQALGTADGGEVDPEYFVSEDRILQAQIEMFTYTQELCERRRTEPRDDIMSALLQVELDGNKLSDAELGAFFMFLTAAGNETTRNAAAYGMSAFLDDPAEWDKLVQDPEGLVASATEEILRWATPVMYLRRNVTADVELRGHTLKAGDKVSVWYISANRDEAIFDDPFHFDIERDPNEHVAFGAGGPHFCLGASLARLELRVLFEELARRVPRLRALGPPAPLRSNIVAGIKHLPVDLRAATPARTR